MKKHLLTTSFLLTSLTAPLLAEESKSIYLSIGGGIASPSDVKGDTTLGGTKYDATFPTDNTGFYSAAIGKKFNDFRIEFNYSQADVDTDSITLTTGGNGVTASISPNLEVEVKSYMFYGYKDFPNESKFTPYIGLGLGSSTFSAKDQNTTVSGTRYSIKGTEESVFSYAAKGGADYEISDNTSLYSEVTYQKFASYNVTEPGFNTVNYDSHDLFAVSLGLKFNF